MPNIVSDTIQLHIAAMNPETDVFRFLVLHRADNSPVYPSLWQVITGRIEIGETSEEAARRECYEETGIVVDRIWALPFVASYFDPYKDTLHVSPVFAAIVDHNKAVKISHEHQDYKWLGYEECRKILKIPSHRKGTKVFMKNVIESEDKDLFKIKNKE